ncbi:unnamed protein product, partial [Symbiodinium sp. KB8]
DRHWSSAQTRARSSAMSLAGEVERKKIWCASKQSLGSASCACSCMMASSEGSSKKIATWHRARNSRCSWPTGLRKMGMEAAACERLNARKATPCDRTGPGSVPKHQALFGFDFHRLSTLRPGTSATNVLGGEQLLAAEEVRAKSLDGSLSMYEIQIGYKRDLNSCCDYDLCEICYKHHAEGWASAVQKRGFASRDAAMTFASRNGAPLGGVLLLGPLRLELEDHPWLDGWRELREASTGWCRHLRSLFRQARGLNPGPILPTAGIDRTGVPAAPDRSPAGLVVDVRRGTRIRAWGPQERLAMCEKAAADAGEFNVSEWATNSSSVKGLLAWARRTGPLVWRVLSLLDWRRLFMTSRRNDTCFSIGCQSRALESRNLQLALLLARCNLLGLWHGPMDFDDLEEQEIVSASNQRALRSEPDLDLGEDDEDDVDLQQPTLEALTCLVLQEREKRKRAERALKKVASRLQQLQNRLEDKPGIWSLGSRHPQIHPSAYVAPGASIIGTVTLRKDASVWFNCTLRGDNEVITIGEGSDIQDNSVLHCDPGKPLVVGRNCLVGHQVCLHGCRIGENCLIGMRTTILDNVVIGSNCFVAAGSFIGEGRSFPDNSLIGGNPAKRIADLETDPAKMAAVMNAASSKGLAANRPEAPAGYVENKERYTKDLNLSSSLCVGSCIIIRSACDAWQPVLTGAVFNLVNGDKHEVERESHFLHFLCSWTFGCSGRLPLARSVILGLMLAAVVQGVARVIGDGVKKEMRNRQNSEMRAAMFEHLLAQDQALYDTLRQRDLVRKVELRALSEVTEWVWGMTADTVKLATQMIFLFAISPLMTPGAQSGNLASSRRFKGRVW